MYMTFISQCMDLCKTAGTSLTERYACQLSLTVVALGAIGFIGEVFNALEYIKGKRSNKLLRRNQFESRHATCSYKI